MSEIDDGGPAFPGLTGVTPGATWPGMNLRDWFAGQALNTMINKCEDRDRGWDVHAVATGAYAVADAMIAEKRQRTEQEADVDVMRAGLAERLGVNDADPMGR